MQTKEPIAGRCTAIRRNPLVFAVPSAFPGPPHVFAKPLGNPTCFCYAFPGRPPMFFSTPPPGYPPFVFATPPLDLRLPWASPIPFATPPLGSGSPRDARSELQWSPCRAHACQKPRFQVASRYVFGRCRLKVGTSRNMRRRERMPCRPCLLEALDTLFGYLF